MSRTAVRLRAATMAAALAVLLTVAAPAARVAVAAADPNLRLEAAATYTLDPSAGAVHVVVDFEVTNRKRSTATTYFYYRDLTFAIHDEGSAVRVSDRGGTLRSSVTGEDGYQVVDLRLRRNLLYGQTASFRLAYDLVGGAPRTETATRAGLAFASFDVFAWGDPGRSSVSVHLPTGFEPELYGDVLEETEGPDGLTLSEDSVADSDDFWVGVVAIAEDAYAREAVALEGGVRLEIRSWPEDDEWAATVSGTIRAGLPDLRERIGLDWPVEDVLTVTEVYSILLAGYAGVYFSREDRIEISEDLDELTTLHEASHAWFNERLFVDRWISEGLAETYSASAWKALGGQPDAPTHPMTTDAGRLDLVGWQHPGRIEDEATDAAETYGYNASYWVISNIVREVGEDGMRAVFEAAASDEIAYLGAVDPEAVAPSDDWRRFLDLLEERAGATSAVRLYREYVLGATTETQLDRRADARAAYDDLLEDGDGWLAPYLVRRHMASWSFDKAAEAMAAAREVLELRERVETAARALDLAPGPALETAYEAAIDDLEAATAIGDELVGALDALAAARASLDAAPDLVTVVGLWGETPEVPFHEATAAFEADDPAAALAAAERAAGIVTGAAEVGRQRILVMAGVVGGVTLLLVVVIVVRSRRRRSMTPAPTVPSATLAATPGEAPDPASPRGEDGGAEGAHVDAGDPGEGSGPGGAGEPLG